ncbi:MAG: hypothetical protein AABP62_07555 [Planctomycetota bacterium]
MTADQFEQLLEEFLSRRPFRPFLVELSTGERFEIDHPRAVVLRGGFAVFLGPGTKIHYFDNDSVVQFIDESHAAAT